MERKEPHSLIANNMRLQIATRFINLEGRTHLIKSSCGLSHKTILKLSKELTGRAPRTGKTAISYLWAVKTPENNIEASAFYAIFKKMYDAHFAMQATYEQKHHVSYDTIIFVESFEFLDRIQKNHEMDINRAATILHAVQKGDLVQIDCRYCTRKFLSNLSSADFREKCPVCHFAKKHKRIV